jgi:hypothetical protein
LNRKGDASKWSKRKRCLGMIESQRRRLQMIERQRLHLHKDNHFGADHGTC